MKNLRGWNEFGIAPTTNHAAAGYDFYVPYLDTVEKKAKALKAFEKSCRLLEEYQKASEDKTQDDPKEKESVLSKLKAYEEEAKHRPSKSKSKHKDSQEL